MKLALIGKGTGRELAPSKGKGVTTWGVNDIVAYREVDVCFFMDRHLLYGSQMEELIIKSVEKTNTPVYCTRHFPEMPTSLEYPFGEIKDTFGTDYFTDSFCFMVALALYQGFTELDIYGFNYAFGEKYVSEKPGCSFWLGIALGTGCTVSLYGDHCELLLDNAGNIYSFNEKQSLPRSGIKIRDFKPESKDYSFTVDDRFCIMETMPYQGNYTTMKFVKKLRHALTFNLDENKSLNIRTVIDKATGKEVLIWDENELPDKVLNLTTAEAALIRAWLFAKDDRGDLSYKNLKTYEKFCVNG